MTTEALKSGAVTNLDASPVVYNTSGIGGLAHLKSLDGSVSITDAKTAPSTYQMVRVRSNAIVKHLWVKLDGANTTLTADVGFYYSTGTNDGTQTGKSGKVNTAQEFGAAVDLHAQTSFLDLMKNVTAANMDKEAWDLAGQTSDPGGFFDIVLTTTATNSGAAVVYMEAVIAD